MKGSVRGVLTDGLVHYFTRAAKTGKNWEERDEPMVEIFQRDLWTLSISSQTHKRFQSPYAV